MMRVEHLVVFVVAVSLAINGGVAVASAAENPSRGGDAAGIVCSIEMDDDETLADARVISTDSHMEDGASVAETVCQQDDGTIVTDTITTLSTDGSTTTTRTKAISGWGSITIKAGFQWYTSGLFSYVKCTSMTASYTLTASSVAVKTWETSYTQDYVSIGKANAKVKYYFYNSSTPSYYKSGTFKITCTSSGTISDNG